MLSSTPVHLLLTLGGGRSLALLPWALDDLVPTLFGGPGRWTLPEVSDSQPNTGDHYSAMEQRIGHRSLATCMCFAQIVF